MISAEELSKLMAAGAGNEAGQLAQTRYRINLVENWRIPERGRVLEIACGQGDMTAVLAAAVGENGHVTGVDIAEPGYGAPVTLGDSIAHLLRGPLGSRIDVHFRFDLLDPAVSFAVDAFDYVVLVHGAWYFDDLEQLTRTLERVRPWTKQVCFAEWDLEPRSFDQLAHQLAIQIQGQIGIFKTGSEANVRTPFSRDRLLEVLKQTGWTVTEEARIDTGELQDATWEIDYCLTSSLGHAEAAGVDRKILDWLTSQQDVLRSLVERVPVRPLPSYAIKATREP